MYNYRRNFKPMLERILFAISARGRPRLLEWLLVSLLLVPAVTAVAASGTDATAATRLKAAFLYKFCIYVEWPAASFADASAPLVIGVAAEKRVAGELEQVVVGRRINGREVQVRRIKPGDDIDGIHLLFLGQAALVAEPDWWSRVQNKPVLVVADSAAELTPGIGINFVPEDARLRFDVDLVVAAEQGLSISSQLLLVARRIRKVE